jgi:hypothetical protein
MKPGVIGRIPLVCAVGLVTLGQALGAETKISVEGVGYADDKSVAYEMAKDHVVVLNMAEYYDFKGEDAKNPLNGAKGPCFGKVEVESGKVSGDGYCIWTDRDDQRLVISWTATGIDDSGRSLGDWSLRGGSGKWESAVGGGTYMATSDENTKKETNLITGAVTFK